MKKILEACSAQAAHMVAATKFSLAGLRAAFTNEIAFRQIVFASAAGVCLACVLAGDWLEWVVLVLPLFLAMMVELLNTAVEAVVDRISPEKHPLAKIAKDTASAAQFTAQGLILLVWGSYLLKRCL